MFNCNRFAILIYIIYYIGTPVIPTTSYKILDINVVLKHIYIWYFNTNVLSNENIMEIVNLTNYSNI